MSHFLGACYAKIERAEENIRNLNTEINAYIGPNPETKFIFGQFDEDVAHKRIRNIGEPPPLRFAVIAGEIIHDLRSCLEYLLTALIEANKCARIRQNQFPVCLTEDSFEKACNGGMIEGVSSAAKKLIRDIQPYHAGNPIDDPLAILHSYNVIDKHRLLLVVNVAGRFKIEPAFRKIEEPPVTNPKAKFMTVFLFNPAGPKNEEGEITAQVAFNEFGSAKFEPVIPALTILSEASERTVKRFKGEFVRSTQ